MHLILFMVALAFLANAAASVNLAIDVRKASKKPVVIPPAVAPLSLPAANLAPSVFAPANVECAACHRIVARFTVTPTGPVCANCKPL